MNTWSRTDPTIRFILAQHRIHISKAVLYAIGYPTHIQITITPDGKVLFIKKCVERVFDRFSVPPHIYTDGASVFGLQKAAFAEALLKRLEWDKKGVYRVRGTIVAEDVMAFYFDEAERLDKGR
jgi:hypothetical protein